MRATKKQKLGRDGEMDTLQSLHLTQVTHIFSCNHNNTKTGSNKPTRLNTFTPTALSKTPEQSLRFYESIRNEVHSV